MSVTRLPQWDVTAIEIALDLEPPRFFGSPPAAFSGPAEPRICLVTGFALTSQLKRIVTAVDRAIPARLPSTLRIAPATARAPHHRSADGIAIAPMLTLLRLQHRLIRAIEPGLADHTMPLGESGRESESDRFIREFITSQAIPTFEPSIPPKQISTTRLRPLGITVYRLGRAGSPQSVLGHWAYAPSPRGCIHLRSGP